MRSIQIKIILSNEKELVKTINGTQLDQAAIMLNSYSEASGVGGVTFTDDKNVTHVIPLAMLAGSRTEIKQLKEISKRKRTTKKA